ncbi:MAG: hypothetical protein GC191_04420 [Azospirillum sp.]|nr:hypothetical protein [Azospirillum sp.]
MTAPPKGARRPQKGRVARFADALKPVKARQPLLPVLHTVGGLQLRTIIEHDKVVPGPSPGYAEPLIHLSYGRPLYHPLNGTIDPASNLCGPVVLMFDPELIEDAAGLYPFDSTALANGRLAPLVNDESELDGYELRAIRVAPARLVRAFYGSNFRYLIESPNPERSLFKRHNSALQDYASWLDGLHEQNQMGLSTLELQFDEEIVVSEHLKAIILPTILLADRIIADFLMAYRISAMGYTWFGGEASLYAGAIRQLVAEHTNVMGLARHE